MRKIVTLGRIRSWKWFVTVKSNRVGERDEIRLESFGEIAKMGI